MREKVTAELLDRRRFTRVPLSLPIYGRTVEGFLRGHRFEGETKDVSYQGLSIDISVPNGFIKGSKIKFKTQLYKGDFLLKATCVVRWVESRTKPERSIRMGVELTAVGHPTLWLERIEKEVLHLSNSHDEI